MKRNSRKIVRYIAIVTFTFTIALNFAFANYAFKKKIKSVCSSYRVSVNASAMDFDSDLFSLTLESNRNNFEMVMLNFKYYQLKFIDINDTCKFKLIYEKIN